MAAAINPLQQIERLIAEASTLPPAQPYQPPAQPLAQLAETIRGRAPEVSSSAPRSAGSSAQAADIRADDALDALDAIVGREVLRLVAERPLSAAARTEAVRRLTVALQNPTEQNVRSVLAVLVSDRTDV